MPMLKGPHAWVAGLLFPTALLLCSGEIHGQEGDFAVSPVVRALYQSYPRGITDLAFREGEWSFSLNGEPFSWAGGRLLPLSEGDGTDYDPHPFYRYPLSYRPVRTPLTPEERDLAKKFLSHYEAHPPHRSPAFQNALYRLHDEKSAWAMMKTTYFLGFKVTVHRDILEDLARVEERLNRQMEEKDELILYVRSLKQVSGFNWRPIAGTASLSSHSYGTAIDLVPKSYSGKQTYWRWTMGDNSRWYDLGWDDLHCPPREVVEAFEAEGFVWGGKWFLYDTIHFEYRPEILLLNRVP